MGQAKLENMKFMTEVQQKVFTLKLNYSRQYSKSPLLRSPDIKTTPLLRTPFASAKLCSPYIFISSFKTISLIIPLLYSLKGSFSIGNLLYIIYTRSSFFKIAFAAWSNPIYIIRQIKASTGIYIRKQDSNSMRKTDLHVCPHSASPTPSPDSTEIPYLWCRVQKSGWC